MQQVGLKPDKRNKHNSKELDYVYPWVFKVYREYLNVRPSWERGYFTSISATCMILVRQTLQDETFYITLGSPSSELLR